MMLKALSAADVAAHFNRSEDWVYRNWPKKVREEGMPRPIETSPLAWDSAQFFCWLDRNLAPEAQAACAAFRAAVEAYENAEDPEKTKSDAWWSQELGRRLEEKGAA